MKVNNYYKITIALQILIVSLLFVKRRPVFETRDKHTVDHVIERYIEKSDSLFKKAKGSVEKVKLSDIKIDSLLSVTDSLKIKRDTTSLLEKQDFIIDLFKDRRQKTDTIVEQLLEANSIKDSTIALLKESNISLKEDVNKLEKKVKRRGRVITTISTILASITLYTFVK